MHSTLKGGTPTKSDEDLKLHNIETDHRSKEDSASHHGASEKKDHTPRDLTASASETAAPSRSRQAVKSFRLSQ